MKAFEPGHGFGQFCDPRIELARLDQTIAANRPRVRDIIGDRRKRQRFRTTLEAPFEIAPLDMSGAHAPPANCFEAQIIKGGTMFKGAAAVVEASVPLSQCICS